MADPITAAVAAFAAAATAATAAATTALVAAGLSTAVATAVVSAGTQLVISAAASATMSALSPKPKVNATASQLQTKVGATTPRAVIMGRTAVAGTLLTPTPLKSGKDDRFASNFYALSHAGPSGVVESIIWGDDTVTFDGSGNAIGKYNDNMWLFQKNGDWNQTAISYTGHPVLGSSTPTAWDSTKRARGCLTVALVVRYAAKVLGGNMQTPIFVVDANAVALTDPRTGLTATTQAQRRNPAVWAYSWRLGWFQNSKRVIGLGQASSELHAAGYAYAANVADANGWTISGEATTADDRYAVESAILLAAASVPVERNGLQSVVTSALRSSVGTISSNDLRANPKWRYNTQQSSRPTAIQTRYRSESNRWQMVEGAEVTDASWLTQDAGREKRITVEYPYAAGGSAHVGHLAALDASNAREPLIFTLQCKQQARYAGFVGDAVTISLPEIGLSSTKMVIVSRVVNPDGTVDYELLVETDAKYAFAAGKTSAAPSFTLQPGFDIFSVPQPGAAEWASVAAQITSGATSLPIVRVTGSAADYSFASGVVFKIRLNSGSSPWLVSEDAPPAATQHEFRGLTNATSYIVGVAYRGVTGVEGPVRELAAVTTGTFVAGAADVGLGVNQVINSDLNQDTRGFFHTAETNLTGTGRSINSGRNLTTAPGYFGARNVFWTEVAVASGSLSGDFIRGWAQNGFFTGLAQNQRWASRCRPGDRIFAAADVSVHGMTQARIVLRYSNNTGAYVDEQSFIQTVGDGRVNGKNGVQGIAANFTRVGAFFTAPANAAYCTMAVEGRTLNGAQTAVYIFTCDYQVCVVAAGQITWPPYAPGPTDMAADRTNENTAAAFLGQGNRATTNVYRQSTAPASPIQWDEWQDTSTTPVIIKLWISGGWAAVGEEGATIGAVVGGNFKFPDGSIAPIGRVDNLYNPIGVNQVINSDFNQGTSGFFATNVTNFTGTGLTTASGRNLSGWFGIRNVLWATVSVSSGTLGPSGVNYYLYGWADAGFFGGLANLNRYATRVKAGDRVYVAHRIAAHRCSRAGFELRWFDKDGTLISTTGDHIDGIDSDGGGPSFANGNPALASLVDNFFTAPANAAFASTCPYIASVRASVTNAYIFHADPHICVVPADQITAPVYNAGPVDRASDRTGENTAGAIVGQGTGATANNLTGLNPTEGGKLGGIETGADVTAGAVPSMEGPASISFDVDGAGALSPGSQVPRTLQFIRKRGNTDVSTSTTWSIVSPVNITLGTITNGGVNVTAVAAGLSNFTVRSVRDGVTMDLLVNVTKNTIVVAGGGGKIAIDNTANGIASGTYSEILSVSLVGAPTGVAEITASYDPSGASGTSTNFQLRLTRAGSMIAEGSSFTGIDGTGLITPDWFTEMAQFAGFYSAASGTATWAIEARRTSGSGSITTATGQLVVNQQPT